jgi:hypothetical protein
MTKTSVIVLITINVRVFCDLRSVLQQIQCAWNKCAECITDEDLLSLMPLSDRHYKAVSPIKWVSSECRSAAIGALPASSDEFAKERLYRAFIVQAY